MKLNNQFITDQLMARWGSQRKFSRDAEVSQQALSAALKNGNPTLKILGRIANGLNCKLDDLVIK